MLRLFQMNEAKGFNLNDEQQVQMMRLQQLIDQIAQSKDHLNHKPIAAAAANAEEEEKKEEEHANQCYETTRIIMINTCEESKNDINEND